MQHDPLASLLDIRMAAERALSMIGDASEASFMANEMLRWAVYSQIIIIGEACNRIPDEWQLAHPTIPWRQIVGMRNRLVHGYDNILWDRVWGVIASDLPALLKRIGEILPRAEE